MWRFYDQATGVMLARQFTGSADMAELNTPAGYAAIAGDFDHLSQRVDISVQPPPPVYDEFGKDISPPWYPPVIDYQPPAPAGDELRTWSWDAATKRWVASPTLLALQRAKLTEMRLAAQAADQADITLQGNTFAADAATCSELTTEALLAQMAIADGQAFSLTWERTDGSTVTLTAAQIKAIVRAIRKRTDNIRAQLRTRKASINAATTPAEVAAVTW